MSSSEFPGGQQPPLGFDIFAQATGMQADQAALERQKSWHSVVHTLQEKYWGDHIGQVLAPRAEVWNRVRDTLRATPCDTFSDASQQRTTHLAAEGFHWRFGTELVQQEVQLTTDIGLYYSPSGDSEKGTMRPEMMRALNFLRWPALRRQLGNSALLGVEPQGLPFMRQLPEAEVAARFSEEVVDHAYAMTAQLYIRRFSEKRRQLWAGAAVTFTEQDQPRPELLKPENAKHVMAHVATDHRELGMSAIAAQLEDTMYTHCVLPRDAIDERFRQFDQLTYYLGNSMPVHTKDPYQWP